MKTKISHLVVLFAGALTCHFSNVSADPSPFEMPLQFFVKQHWFSWTNTFDIESEDQKFGTVHRKLFSWTPEYHFYDAEEQVQAKAKMSFFSSGVNFDITDGFEKPLGKVTEKIQTFFSTFDLYRPDGYHAAKAELNFWGTKYTVMDPQTDEVIAYLWRNFFRFKDDWTVDIVKPELIAHHNIDPRLFVLVMAFQTDQDYWKKLKREMDRALGSPMSALAINKDLEQHRLVLESYREGLSDMTPSEAEIDSLEAIINDHLASVRNEAILADDSNAHLEALDRSLTVLLPLFESNELTLSQKSALFIMIENELQGLCP